MFEIIETYKIKNDILDNMTNGLSKIEGSYNYDTAAATAIEINQLYQDVDWLSKQLFPWTVTDDTFLEYHLLQRGMERRDKTKATGEVTFQGKATSIVKLGSIVISRTGQKYKTLEDCVLSSQGLVTVSIEAVEGGEVGNCGIGDITAFEIILSGINSVTNLKAIEGGYEIESIESCRERMQAKDARPAHSGNVYDYENWAKSVGGVGKVKVISAGEHGVKAGNVKVLIADYDLKPASSELVENVQNYINTEKRFVNANTTVESFAGYTMNITIDTVRVKKGTIEKDAFLESFKEKLASSLTDTNFTYGDVISLAKIGVLAMQVDGVLDYDSLNVNDIASNISFEYNQIPIIGTVEVTNYVEA